MLAYNAMNSLSFPYPLVDFGVSKFLDSNLIMHGGHCLGFGSVTNNTQIIPTDHQSAFPSHPKVVTPPKPQWLISENENMKGFSEKHII